MDPTLLLSGHHSPLWIRARRPSSISAASPLSRTPFLGQTLHLLDRTPPVQTLTKVLETTPCRRRLLPSCVIKRRKERPLDNVIERDKKLKLVLKLRRILVNQPDRIMSIRELGKHRRDLGLSRKRRFIALLRRFPAVFEILEEGVYSLKFRLTPEAERLYLEELRLRNELEDLHVTKLRKLLMMSLHKRIPLSKIAHLKADLGLPLEFHHTICTRYPHYFRIVPTPDRGPCLELTHWDPVLASSTYEIHREENRRREIEEEDLIVDRPPKFRRRVKLPNGLKLPRKEMAKIARFRDMPYISPYSDFSDLGSGTPEKEKHACGVVHEILSLTVEKRTLVDHLTHFREEFRFSQQLRGMLVRHPDMFYVSLKGSRDSVFLREAYRDSQLVEKDRLLLLKEKMRALVSVPRFGRGSRPKPLDEDATLEVDDDDTEDLADVIGDLGGDDDDEDGDDWSDDEDGGDWSDDDDIDDETPPDFDDEDGDDGADFRGSVPVRGRVEPPSSSSAAEEKDRVPVLPDGSPRERW